MLQSRRQDLEAQIRGLREEVEKGQGRLQTTHEELLLLRRERQEHSLEVSRSGEAEAGLHHAHPGRGTGPRAGVEGNAPSVSWEVRDGAQARSDLA